MKRRFFFIFILLPISTFLFPLQGTANCDLENSLISLKLIDKPVREILQSVEKQTEFSFDIRDDKALNNKKSIVLNDIPLDQSLRRLLKDVNYSVICNNEKKILTLVFLDTSLPPSATIARKKTDNSRHADMKGVDTAFEQYKNNDKTPVDPQHQKETSMDAAMTAFEEFRNNNFPPLPDPQYQKETSMDPTMAAFKEYKNNKNNPQQTEQQYQKKTSMDAAVIAFKEYKNNRNNTLPPSNPEYKNMTSMDGVIAAFDEYNKIK